MAVKNLLGGLALDSTLRELLELMDVDEGQNDFAMPVMGIDGAPPVQVSGDVRAKQPGIGNPITTKMDVSSTTINVWYQAVAANPYRTGLEIKNFSTSATAVYVAFGLVPTANTALPVPIAAFDLLVGEYWSAPAKHVGPVAIQWVTASVAATLRITEYV